MQNIYKISPLILGLVFWITPVFAQTESPYIFKIKTNHCKQKPQILTGFRVKGLAGIITALHGVVSCQTIVARGINIIGFRNLKITKADVSRDVALLYSSELSSSLVGLEPSKNSSYDGLHVMGHPLGIQAQLTSKLQIRQTPRRVLRTLITPDLSKQMEKRNSPNLGIDILSIEGHLSHGHSGAPILNGNGQVVGISNGGLLDGYVEIVWAIPWHDISWKRTKQSDLRYLADSPVLFSSPSEERQVIKIGFTTAKNFKPEHFIHKTLYSKRSVTYLLFPQDLKIEPQQVQQIIIKGVRDNLLARGIINSVLSSDDGKYEFKVIREGGFFVLTVKPVKTYDVTLVLPSRIMNKAKIFVDGEPAKIIEVYLTGAVIQVKDKKSNHKIEVIKKGNRVCQIEQLIRNNERLSPCV